MKQLLGSVALVAVCGLAAAADRDTKVSAKDFLPQAIASGLKEVRVSEHAVKNAANEKVREFARTLVRDHRAMNEKLMALAKERNLAVVGGIDEDKKVPALTRLLPLKGEEFDREYMRMMVQDHEKAVRMFAQHAEDDAAAADTRRLAREALPDLRKQLEHARSVARDIGATGRQGER